MIVNSETQDKLEIYSKNKYKYGFITDIDSEKPKKGLSEDTIKFISLKKNEPKWMLDWRLKAYSKKYFDPFCRRERIFFHYKDEEYLETTVGQLNFFKWIIEHNIINYIKNNYDDIEFDMQNTIKLEHESNIKRRELSKCATKTINVNESRTILKFE